MDDPGLLVVDHAARADPPEGCRVLLADLAGGVDGLGEGVVALLVAPQREEAEPDVVEGPRVRAESLREEELLDGLFVAAFKGFTLSTSDFLFKTFLTVGVSSGTISSGSREIPNASRTRLLSESTSSPARVS